MEKVLSFLKEKKVLCGFVSLGLVAFAFFGLYIQRVAADEAYVCPKTQVSEETIETENQLIVDIKGAVVHPGVYYVEKGTIVNDVILLAGGITEDADTRNLNLSKKVANEMVITVYTKEELANSKILDAITEEIDLENQLISLNTATLEELMTLPGIGEAKAKIILQYRDTCGPFQSKEELKNIKGIGEAIYEKLENYITI